MKTLNPSKLFDRYHLLKWFTAIAITTSLLRFSGNASMFCSVHIQRFDLVSTFEWHRSFTTITPTTTLMKARFFLLAALLHYKTASVLIFCYHTHDEQNVPYNIKAVDHAI